MNLLMPAIGKKFFLAETFAKTLDLQGAQLVATDLNPEAPAGKNAHHFYAVPRLSDPTFEAKFNELAQKHAITAILPTRQQEFAFWNDFCKHRPEFALLLSSRETIDICANKKSSYDWLKKNNFSVSPYIMKSEGSFEDLSKVLGPLPWFGKPFDGSASIGAGKTSTREEFEKLSAETMLQPVLHGDEYTINCYVDRKGKCRAVVPHLRIETRDGEVSVGVTVRHPYILEIGKALAEALPGAYGPLCLQVYYDPSKGPMGKNSVVFTDLNARFGGGYPLCHAAGGKFVDWLILEAQSKPLPAKINLQDGVRFIRGENGEMTFAHPAEPIKKTVQKQLRPTNAK